MLYVHSKTSLNSTLEIFLKQVCIIHYDIGSKAKSERKKCAMSLEKIEQLSRISLRARKSRRTGQHLLDFLNLSSLEGLTFVDIGCGSGIHSLAALMAGAESVTSFDYDNNSVAFATRLVKKCTAIRKTGK